MNKPSTLIAQLFSIRNRYGGKFALQKTALLQALSTDKPKTKKALESLEGTLFFLIAYPDNALIHKLAARSLEELHQYVQTHETIKESLYNSGITNTRLCAAFSFEIVKWLRKNHPTDISLSSFEAGEGEIQSILSVVMPKVESEILQDGNAGWRTWLMRSAKKRENLLDRLIAVFSETDLRPEVRDELWAAIGLNIEINFSTPDFLTKSLIIPYYHRSLIKKKFSRTGRPKKTLPVNLDETQAAAIIRCARMVLIRHLREIDPITFSSPRLVSYYQLPRGLSMALMGMVTERRHPIDSYMGYVVFKNGLPVAYAGSWILFDSSRIGINVFPAYRGGESQYIFEQVLMIHREVYRLKRFTVDPYQIGKDNSDAISSGAFWIYYNRGFRPLREEQRKIAKKEAGKIKSIKGYRSPAPVLKKLADSRMELILDKNAVRFDATDLSLVYSNILMKEFNNDRKIAEEISLKKLKDWLRIKDPIDMNLQFILKNWAVLLFPNKEANSSRLNDSLKKTLIRLFTLKAKGSEEEYIKKIQSSGELRQYMEYHLKNYT